VKIVACYPIPWIVYWCWFERYNFRALEGLEGCRFSLFLIAVVGADSRNHQSPGALDFSNWKPSAQMSRNFGSACSIFFFGPVTYSYFWYSFKRLQKILLQGEHMWVWCLTRNKHALTACFVGCRNLPPLACHTKDSKIGLSKKNCLGLVSPKIVKPVCFQYKIKILNCTNENWLACWFSVVFLFKIQIPKFDE
jgi:hypothetical protein